MFDYNIEMFNIIFQTFAIGSANLSLVSFAKTKKGSGIYNQHGFALPISQFRCLG